MTPDAPSDIIRKVHYSYGRRKMSQKTAKDLLLLDFYGNLLTERMRGIMELYLFEDLSLSEIAETCDISRQGVHDTIKRGKAQLEEDESRLGLIEMFDKQKDLARRAIEKLDQQDTEEARRLLVELTDEL